MLYDGSWYLSKQDRNKLMRNMSGNGKTKLYGASYTTSDEFLRLWSYETLIMAYGINKEICGEPILFVDRMAFDYSRTTCRHISIFLNKYFHLDYSEVKHVCSLLDPIRETGEFATIDGVNIAIM